MGNFKTTLNGIDFNSRNWSKRFSEEDYKRILTQVRKLIGIGKLFYAKKASTDPIDTKRKVSKVTQQEQCDQRVDMVLHHAMKSKLMS